MHRYLIVALLSLPLVAGCKTGASAKVASTFGLNFAACEAGDVPVEFSGFVTSARQVLLVGKDTDKSLSSLGANLGVRLAGSSLKCIVEAAVATLMPGTAASAKVRMSTDPKAAKDAVARGKAFLATHTF
jgi:hypothetical protein